MKFTVPRLWQVALVCVGTATALPGSARATAQVSLTAGNLLNKGGTGMLTAAASSSSTAGSLLLLVAANPTTNTFTDQLASGQYVAGGDIILASAAFNTFAGAGGTSQSTTNTLNFTLPGTVTAGTTLVQLRWFPSITLTQFQGTTTPVNGTTYGVYNPGLYSTVNGTSLKPDGGMNWVVPADGSTGYALDFYTTDTGFAGAKQAIGEGYAFLTVPEPSAGVLSGLALIAMVGSIRSRRRCRFV